MVSLGAADDATVMLRLSELMIPFVTVFDRPRGAPIATAVSPTFSLLESAKLAGWKLATPSTLMTARSEIGSVPTTVAS